jgi:thioredoxin-related protein
MGERNFKMLAVDLAEPIETVTAFLKAHKLTMTVLLDTTGEIGRRFGIRSIPTTFILDKNGSMIGKAFGSRQWGGKSSIDFFEYLLNMEKGN